MYKYTMILLVAATVVGLILTKRIANSLQEETLHDSITIVSSQNNNTAQEKRMPGATSLFSIR